MVRPGDSGFAKGAYTGQDEFQSFLGTWGWNVFYKAAVIGNNLCFLEHRRGALETARGCYLETLPANTPAKIEVGAIGADDNATFSEEDEICLNDEDPDGTWDDEEEAILNGCGFEVGEEDDE